MVLSGSARSKKCQLIKSGKTEAQAMQYLFEHGYIPPLKLVESINQNITHSVDKSITHSASDDEKPPVIREYESITEDVWKDCLLELVNTAPTMTTGIIDKIRDYLDKKGAIQAKKQTRLPIGAEDHILEFSNSDSTLCP